MASSLRYQAIELVVLLLIIQFLDIATAWQIHSGAVFTEPMASVLLWFDLISTFVFIGLAIALTVALIIGRERIVDRIAVVYLTMALIQVSLNVLMLVGSAHVRNDSVLWGLWDLGAGYFEIVAVFTGWYFFVDHALPDGAFAFPERNVRPEFRPRIIDYAFIAFNTNATFGPTAETILSRFVKVLMMVQTLLSLALLLVFVARIVSLFN